MISKELEMVPLLLTFLLLMPHSKERGEATDAIVSTIADVVCLPVLIIAHVAREVPVAGEELPDIPVVNASPLGNPLNDK